MNAIVRKSVQGNDIFTLMIPVSDFSRHTKSEND